MDELRAWIALRAKELRKSQTPQEQKLWASLRSRRFANFKFRRQVLLERYIVDFVCFEQKLVIELDGVQHLERKAYDKSRDDWLIGQGYRVLRFWNHQVDREYVDVLGSIYRGLVKYIH
jgi:very-short-patch-repair endonuclease